MFCFWNYAMKLSRNLTQSLEQKYLAQAEVAWNEFASLSFYKVIIFLFNFSISFFCPNSSFYFYFNIFSLLMISSLTFLLLASILYNYFLYISRYLFNFSIKDLSFPQLFLYQFNSFYNQARPRLIFSFNDSRAALASMFVAIQAQIYSIEVFKFQCFYFYMARSYLDQFSYFYLRLIRDLKFELISQISCIFFNYDASSFSNFLQNFFSFQMRAYKSLTCCVNSLNLLFKSFLAYLLVPYYPRARSNSVLIFYNSSFLFFLLSYYYFTVFYWISFFLCKISYYFFSAYLWFSIVQILALIQYSYWRLESRLTWRIYFYFQSYSLLMVYQWTDATCPSVIESFCYISICNFFIQAFNFQIFCFEIYSCSLESSRYLYVLATSALRYDMVCESSLENLRADCNLAAPAMMSLDRSLHLPSSFFYCSWEWRRARWILSYSILNLSKV